MSKFIEKIKRGTQVTPSPMGFRTAAVQNKAKIVLVAMIDQANADNSPEYLAAADACLLAIDDLKSGTLKLKQLNQSAAEIPWGGWLKNSPLLKGDVQQIEADFFIFNPVQPPLVLPESSGRILAINSQMSDSLLRAIDDLPVDAVIVTDATGSRITWQFMAELQRVDNLISKPILIFVPVEISNDELLTLWGVGVDGLLLDMSAVTAEAKLKELHEYIGKTNFPLPRKTRKAHVTLPVISSETQTSGEEEEEEEEE